MTQTFFLIAGEASGDSLGAGLMRELKSRHENSPEGVAFTGIGGELMAEQGLETLLPMEELSVMGIWEVVWQLPRLWKLIKAVVHEIETRQPDVVVTIDAQDFNLAVASKLKKNGVFKGKIVQYVAPTVWAWRPGRAKVLARVFDGLMCLFPFEPDYFTPHGLKTGFVGHPLSEKNIDAVKPGEFRKGNRIAEEAQVVGVFFGSRQSELNKMAAPLMKTISIIKERYPDIEVVVPTLPHLEFDVIQVLRTYGCEATVVADKDLKWDTFSACDVGLAVSGTVGLELAYAGVPHVIAYTMHPLTWLAVRTLVKVKYAHLANILLDKPVVPEFLQKDCDPIKISKTVLALLKDKEKREKQREEFASLRAQMAGDQANPPSVRAADFVLSIQE